ncbi:MAG: restriction endonuclease [Acidimicrobiaceae bacterium]|nr:restriction endonuclease [Acidimicrobiaceae bacterium]MDE0515069.1 restriction endonuclease [Acidimicrobiaceae bacterium]
MADALSTFHWYKREFQTLVRVYFAEAPDVLGVVNFDATKRVATGELIRALRLKERTYQHLVVDALVELSEFDPDFPHLARLDDGPARVSEARAAHNAVRAVVKEYSELVAARESVRREAERRRAQESARRLHDEQLDKLKREFLKMHQSSDEPQARGRAFERFLNALFSLWDLYPRASYSIEHEQIDGAFTFRTDDYILEARWQVEPLQPKDLNDFRVKVDGKARNTLGLYVSISGFTDGAIKKHSHGQTPLILMDGTDLMPILEGHIEFDEVLARKRRHAAETGNPMYRA